MRVAKKTSITLLIIGLVLLAFGLGVEFFLQNFAEDQIKDYLNSRENRQYNLEFKRLRISLFEQKIKLLDLKITPIDQRVEKVKNQESFQTMVWLDVDQVNLNNIDFWEMATQQDFKVQDLRVIRPSINVLFGNEKKQEEETEYDGSAIHQLIYQENIRNIKIREANLNFFNEKDLESPFLEIDSLNLDYAHALEGVKEASIRLHTANLYNEFEGGFYYKASELEYDNQSDLLTVKSFETRPKADPFEYTSQFELQESWLSFKFNSLSVEGIDLDSMILQPSRMHLQEVKLNDAYFTLFFDRRKEPKPEEEGFLLTTLIHKIPFQLTVDSTKLTNGNIDYACRYDISDSNALLSFTNIDASVKNFTNSPHYQRKNQTCVTKASGQFSGQSKIHAELKLALTDGRDRFKLSAVLDTMALTDLNKYTDAALNTHIKSGELFKCELDIRGDHEKVSGSLVTAYKDLHIQFLKEHDQMIKVNPFKAEKDRGKYLLVNTLMNGMLNKNNKPKGLFYKKSGMVFYEKALDDNFIDLLVGGILSGINSNAISDQMAKQHKKNYEKRKRKEYKKEQQEGRESFIQHINPFGSKK